MAKRFKKMRSPIGEAVWPKLSQPETKFDPDGVYEIALSVSVLGQSWSTLGGTFYRKSRFRKNEVSSCS